MTRADQEAEELVGSSVGAKYRIDRLLGRGGMGAVYEATNVEIGKRVALKFLEREAARDADAVTRFQREAQAASAVESAHIVQIFDSGRTAEGRPYLVMELLKGEDLRQRLRRRGRLGVAETVHIASQVARALARAHQAGIVHRDLKPDNVFLADRDDDSMFVKLVDFGISKIAQSAATVDTLTRRGTVLGTAYYMSPEQAQAFADIDGRADLWSLGAILYECLSGHAPHTGTTYESVLVKICTKDAAKVTSVAPDVPERIGAIVDQLLARNRDERPGSAEDLLEALVVAAPDLVPSGPISAARRTPSSSDLTRPLAGVATESGTAVQTSSKDPARARAVVAAVVAALGTFALTAFLMARARPVPDPRAVAPTPVPAAVQRAPVVRPPAAPALASVSPSSPAIDAGARAAARESPRAASPGALRGGSPRASKPPAAAVQKKGVVSGLQLDTSGP